MHKQIAEIIPLAEPPRFGRAECFAKDRASARWRPAFPAQAVLYELEAAYCIDRGQAPEFEVSE